MKLFRVPGGVHPDYHKTLSADCAIRAVPMPDELVLPMHQHIGIPASPMVEVGAKVAKGDVIAICAGGVVCKTGITSPVHAPTSGTITKIEKQVSPHPSGLLELMITLVPDGEDQWGERLPPLDPNTASEQELAVRIHESGIVGLGGAAFPTAAKLDARKRFALHTLIINGAECEPYLTADDRLMREGADNVVDGILILKKILNVSEVIIGIEDNKHEAIKAMRKVVAPHSGVSVATVPTRYPMGSEKHLVQALTGDEVPAGGLPADLGIIVNNAGTAYATHEAVRFGLPLISRIVTVSGGAVKDPGNFEVLLGTRISHLFENCGGFKTEPEQVMIGGPMMGNPVSNLDVPVIKGTNGVLALTREEIHPGIHRPCIRCGACITACPCGLEPQELAVLVRNEKIEVAIEAGLGDCISCGACSYVCPSHIPLVQFFNYGKARINELRDEQDHAQKLKRLSDERKARNEEKERQKKAKQEARKKAIAARQKAEAEKAAQEAAGQDKPGQEQGNELVGDSTEA